MSLIPTQIVFLQRLLADRAKLRDASGAATFFAEHHRIGMRMGRRFEYRDQDFDRATALLTSLGLSLNAVATGGTGPKCQSGLAFRRSQAHRARTQIRWQLEQRPESAALTGARCGCPAAATLS